MNFQKAAAKEKVPVWEAITSKVSLQFFIPAAQHFSRCFKIVTKMRVCRDCGYHKRWGNSKAAAGEWSGFPAEAAMFRQPGQGDAAASKECRLQDMKLPWKDVTQQRTWVSPS